MKKAIILLAVIVTLSGCNLAKPAVSPETASSELTASEDISDSSEVASEAASSSEAAASEAAAKAASEAAASEAAAKAASEAAASEAAVKAASEAAASESSVTAAKTETVSVTGKNFLSSVEKSILTKINAEREAEGLDALTYDENLRSAARIRSRELCKADKFEHKRPNGDEWQTVLEKDVPVQYIAAGENLCMTEYNDPDNDTARDASFWVEQWMNSPPHYENIMRAEFTHAGVGLYYIEKNGMVYAYATMIFAKL
ncbi:MAG: CAP domain-containing protein [Ruminococcaceae bacterium]|nr:CAP domain-containing protein [Oscillospiraceae bacterium]